jgi:hypothetical protein
MIEFIDKDSLSIEEINLYLLDSTKTIKQRLCSKLNIDFTVNNEYIQFLNDIDFLKQSQTIYYLNFYQKIIDSAKQNKMFAVKHLSFDDYFIPFLLNNKTLISSIESMISNKHYDLSFYFNQYYSNIQDFIDKNEYADKIKKIVGTHTSLSSFQKRIAFLITETTNKLNLFMKKELVQTNYIKSFEETEGESFTDFVIEANSISIHFKIDKSILELFNDILVNETYSFVKCKGFYKFFKHQKPNLEWLNEKDELDEKIHVFYNNKIMFITEIEPETFTVEFITTVPTESSLSELKLIFNEIFTFRINDFFNIQSTEIKGDFTFPSFRFNKYVMSDLISINEIFRNLFTLNEDKVPQSQKSTFHVYFKKNQIKLTSYFSYVLSNEVPVFNVKVRSSKFDFIQPYQLILSKLLVKEYKTKFDSIVKVYQKYQSIIPSFEEKFTFTDGRLVSMKEKADVFPAKYRSKVQKYPNIYSNDDETLENIRKNKTFEVMKFPTYPMNLVDDSVRYVCDRSKGYTVPGVNINTFENKDKYPYLPQCFQKEQILKKKDPVFNQRFRYYNIEGKDDVFVPEVEVFETLPVKEDKQQKIKLSGFMSKNIYGYLPEKIREIFIIADSKIDDYDWYRLGVTDNNNINSFIISVLTALQHDDLTSFNIDDIRTEILADLAVLAKQENFDKSLIDITTDIVDNNSYLNPRLYIHLLEHRYKCNIILFDKNNFILPRSINGYYQNKNDYNYIFIYEHNDETQYCCEVIGRYKLKEKTFQSLFDAKKSICQTIMNLYFNLYDIETQIFPKFETKSQIIDASGKCRGINVDFNDTMATLFFQENVFQPIDAPIGDIFEIEEEKIDLLKTTFALSNVVVKEGFLNANIIIDGRKILVFFKIKSGNQISLSSFNLYNKLSRYISQYFIWYYSTFLHQYTDIKNIYHEPFKNLDIILSMIDINVHKDNFIKQCISIVPTHQYTLIPNKFSLENSGIIINNKLVIKSNDTLRKLFYVLKMFIQRHLISFLSFFQKKTIDNYYIDVIDFDQKPLQIICKGYDYTLQWIQDFFDNTLFSANFVFNILRDDKTCFLYQNLAYFNGKMFTVYRSSSLNNAISISLNAKNIFNDEPLDYILSTFKNNKLLSSYYVNHDQPNSYNIHIVTQNSLFFSFLT